MGKEVVFDYSRAAEFISAEEMENFKTTVMSAKDTLVNKSGAGNDFLGWIDLPVDYDRDEFARIKKAAAKIQGDSDVLLVIGIGGSYLGARAAIVYCGSEAGVGGKGFLHQYHFQVGNNHRTGHSIPCV